MLAFIGGLQVDVASSSASPSSAEVHELRVLTYNVLADPVYVEQRVPALLQILGDSRADIIVLQEVTPWFAEMLLREPWTRQYQRSVRDGKTIIAHEHLVLTRFPILDYRQVPLSGRQGRVLFSVTVDLAGQKTAIATCHLESLLDDGLIRAQQLDAFFAQLESEAEVFFAGDFNFGDGEQPETSRLPDSYRDAWLELMPKRAGYTWDIRKSSFARQESLPGEGSRRLDRILFRSACWAPVSITILGDTAVAGERRGVFPSDHFGLLAVFRRSISESVQYRIIPGNRMSPLRDTSSIRWPSW